MAIRSSYGAATGGRLRMVPLWWNAGALEGLAAWNTDRVRHGATPDEPLLASLIPGRAIKTSSRHTLRKRFRTASKVVGAADSRRWRFATGATHLLATPWLTGERWPRFATLRGIAT